MSVDMVVEIEIVNTRGHPSRSTRMRETIVIDHLDATRTAIEAGVIRLDEIEITIAGAAMTAQGGDAMMTTDAGWTIILDAAGTGTTGQEKNGTIAYLLLETTGHARTTAFPLPVKTATAIPDIVLKIANPTSPAHPPSRWLAGPRQQQAHRARLSLPPATATGYR